MRRVSRHTHVRLPVTLALATVLAWGTAAPAQAAPSAPPTPPPGAARGWSESAAPPAEGEEQDADRLPVKEREEVLGEDHAESRDTAWTTIGDATGFHLLIAEEAEGYRWRTAATLAEPGFVDTDTWIGNACVTDSGDHALVAYAPRTFTNKPELMARGAFTAAVALDTGEVTKLPFQASLAYFSPGCGYGDRAVLSQFTDERTSDRNRTRLITVDARTGRVQRKTTVAGQVTSAIPTRDGVVAAQGNAIVRIPEDGKPRTVARTEHTPFGLAATKDGGLAFLDRRHDDRAAERTRGLGTEANASAAASAGAVAQVKFLTGGQVQGEDAKARTLAEGDLTAMDLTRAADGTAIITGEAENVGTLPRAVRNPGGLDKEATASTRGRAVVNSAWADGKDTRVRPAEYDSARTARIRMSHLATGRESTLASDPAASPVAPDPAQGLAPSPALGAEASKPAGTAGAAGGAGVGAMSSSGISEPESERTCAVERGNPEKQAFQPKPRQIEWAVDRAIEGTLDDHVYRAADWKNMGMAAYAPQALVGGLTPLSGGGRIPAQVFLGITAQESNMWQATRFAAPGTTANSLIGNYYGLVHDAHGQVDDPWAINWPAADCGYGITQVTDGMRLPGKPYPDGEVRPSMPRAYQEAVALDYTANVAAGVNILAEKWNQTRDAGLTVNNGDPKAIENWFFALWAYNSGFYPESAAGGNAGKWGVGWANNPANPTYKPNRTPFLENAWGGDDYSHAATPQYWPYPEKVIGWAARPLEALESPGTLVHGFRPAWWIDPVYRTQAKPPVDLFCDGSNECDPAMIKDGASNDSATSGPCQREDFRCWWHSEVEWKNCAAATCGFELFRFDNTYPEEADGNSHPPRCSSGLPTGTAVVDNVDTGQQLAGADPRRCWDGARSSGSFRLDFATPSAKMDTHQLGVGYGNHIWFSTTREAGSDEAARMKVTGTWTGPSDVAGWTRVLVHMPSVAARSQQARYTVSGTDSTSPHRVAPQRIRGNEWRSLGVFDFTGTPKVSLSNITEERVGVDIAWDAVAFQKLGSDPTHVVGMGDSFASGEGADSEGGKDYFRETDYTESIGGGEVANKCHRSEQAWIRQATLPGMSRSIGAISDDHGDVDLSFVACSGARTYNVVSGGEWQYGNSLPQLDLGYLDQNTDIVTIAIGGNDALFADVIAECVFAAGLKLCQDAEFEKRDPDTGAKTGEMSGPLRDFVPDWVTHQVKPRIVEVLGQIRNRAPNAEVYLVGYPPLFSGNGQCVPGIGTAEAPWLNDVVAPHLSAEMLAAATTAGATFVDPAADFASKAICGDPESIHGIVLFDRSEADSDAPEPSMKSFHPKISGARLYADALERAL